MESKLNNRESEATEGCLMVRKHEGEQMEVCTGWNGGLAQQCYQQHCECGSFFSRVFPWEGWAEVEGR